MGKSLVALVTAGLLLGNAAAAAAADLCLDSPLSLVLKAFTPPARGVCKETRGFYREALIWMSGTACGSSDGDDITFAQTGVAGTVLVTDTFRLNRQTMSGPGVLCVVGGQCFPDTWTKMACQPTTVPVP
jgi:hypothetical protein